MTASAIWPLITALPTFMPYRCRRDLLAFHTPRSGGRAYPADGAADWA